MAQNYSLRTSGFRILMLLCVYTGIIAAYAIICKNYTRGLVFTKMGSFLVVRIVYALLVGLILARLHGKAPFRLFTSFNKVTKAFAVAIYSLMIVVFGCFIEELLWNPDLIGLAFDKILLTVLLEAMLFISLFLVIRNYNLASMLYLLCNWIYGTINFFVLEFRGRPPMFSDFLVARTAITVAREYEYALSDNMVIGTLVLIALFNVLLWFPIHLEFGFIHTKKNAAFYSFFIIVLLTAVWYLIIAVVIPNKLAFRINGWQPEETFKANGAPLSMLSSISQSRMKKPEGYTDDYAMEVLDKSRNVNLNDDANQQRLPNIIVIMNESFSDLSVLGEFDSDDYLKYWKDINSYVRKGYVFSSVRGGGTCNSEFEFLTGTSMANVGGTTSYPYVMLDLSDSWNVAGCLKELGYETIAFHPYTANNWNRNAVYKDFGFNSYIADGTMGEIEDDCISWGISDKSDYHKIMDIFKESPKPLFLFNVTMQNHGGYNIGLRSDIELVKIESDYCAYSDVINYLTLMRESDSAFYELLETFSEIDEPTIICMFGDHQPGLAVGFENSLLGNWNDSLDKTEKRFMTPYIVWSNYDTGIEPRIENASINYLGAMVLNIAGIKGAYIDYLMKLKEEIPVINSSGYQDKNGEWHYLNEENDNIIEYGIVQYYELTSGDHNEHK